MDENYLSNLFSGLGKIQTIITNVASVISVKIIRDRGTGLPEGKSMNNPINIPFRLWVRGIRKFRDR